MKKIISIILALALLCGCAALAETTEKEYMATIDMNGVFELHCTMPEGYKLESAAKDESSQLFVISAGEDKPEMVLSIVFDEMYADVKRLNDMDEADKAFLLSTWSEEDVVENAIVKTDYGTELFLIREAEGAMDFATFFTIYNGYEIEFTLFAASDSGLTEEQIQTALKFLSDLDFVTP